MVSLPRSHRVQHLPVVPQTLPPVLDGVGHDGGVVELPRHEDQLLAPLAPPHLLVEARGVAVGQRVPRVLRVQLGVLQDLPLGRRQPLREEQEEENIVTNSEKSKLAGKLILT